MYHSSQVVLPVKQLNDFIFPFFPYVHWPAVSLACPTLFLNKGSIQAIVASSFLILGEICYEASTYIQRKLDWARGCIYMLDSYKNIYNSGGKSSLQTLIYYYTASPEWSSWQLDLAFMIESSYVMLWTLSLTLNCYFSLKPVSQFFCLRENSWPTRRILKVIIQRHSSGHNLNEYNCWHAPN